MERVVLSWTEESIMNKAVFSTKNLIEDLSKTTKYLLDSSDDIKFFFENEAFDSEGNFKYPLMNSMNKIGHGIHDAGNKVFEKFCYSEEVKKVCREIFEYKAPVIV